MNEAGFREKLYAAADRWDLWGYGGFGLPRIELEGDRYMLIEEHGGLLEYGPECIRIAARGLTIAVMGSGLEIASMESGSLGLRGRIRQVQLEGEER